jgi:hypothetical protein
MPELAHRPTLRKTCPLQLAALPHVRPPPAWLLLCLRPPSSLHEQPQPRLPVLPLREGEKIAIGGLELKTLKKEKGARFGLPFSSIVLAKQIGLGPTALNK